MTQKRGIDEIITKRSRLVSAMLVAPFETFAEPNLFLSAYPTTLMEGDRTQVSVWFNGLPLSVDRTVTIRKSDILWVNTRKIVIPAGQLKTDFTMTALQNEDIGENPLATITAEYEGQEVSVEVTVKVCCQKYEQWD